MIVSYEKNVGDAVSEGETVLILEAMRPTRNFSTKMVTLILEAMKMETALPAPCGGTIQAINYKSGDTVAKGDVLCVIG